MGTNRFFNPGTSLDVTNGTVSDETDINDVVDDVTDSFNLVEDDITLLAAEVFTGGILDNTGLTTPVTLGYTAAVPPATPAEYSVTLVNDAAANINSVSTDGTLAGNTDTDIPTEKAVKTYVDTGLATKLAATLSTDGTLAANLDTNVSSQKAVKTYVDTGLATKPTAVLDTSTDLDGAGASDAKVPSQLAVKTYADTKVAGTLSTDGTMAGNSDTDVPSEQAVKTYVDASVASSTGEYFPNILLNQEMMVDQRNGSLAVTSPSGSYLSTADRWRTGKDATDELVATVQKISGFFGSSYTDASRAYLQATTTTKETTVAADEFFKPFSYKFSSVESSQISFSGPFTLSFNISSNAPSGTIFSVSLSGLILVSPYSYISDFEYTSTGVTQNVVINNINNSVVVDELCIAAYGGSNYQTSTLDSWVSDATDNLCSTTATNWISISNTTYVSISSVQLTSSSSAQTIKRKSFSEYLRECQAFYEKSYDTDVVPGAADDDGAISEFATRNSATWTKGSQFKETKSAVPTVTIYAPTSGNSGNVTNNGDKVAAADNIGTQGFSDVTITGGDTAQNCLYHWTAEVAL